MTHSNNAELTGIIISFLLVWSKKKLTLEEDLDLR
jgi:hypothetical protein